MDVVELREYCLSLPCTEECTPFGEDTLVFKVSGKMYAFVDLIDGDRMNVKCDPDKAIELRERYESVQPGYHMNKRHWNTILINADLPDSLIKEWIADSYKLVVKSLPRICRAGILEE